MNRSDGPIVQGYWQAAADTVELPAGTSVHLLIRLTWSERIFGTLLLVLLLVSSLLCGVFTRPLQAPLVPVGMLFFFTSLFVFTGRWSLRKAERYFQRVLALTKAN